MEPLGLKKERMLEISAELEKRVNLDDKVNMEEILLNLIDICGDNLKELALMSYVSGMAAQRFETAVDKEKELLEDLKRLKGHLEKWGKVE